MLDLHVYKHTSYKQVNETKMMGKYTLFGIFESRVSLFVTDFNNFFSVMFLSS